MKFANKSEIYTFSLYTLESLQGKDDFSSVDFYIETINAIRALYENHNQDINHVITLIESLHAHASKNSQATLEKLIQDIKNSNLEQQTLVSRFENPLRRRFDSEIFAKLLLTPTPAIMKVVGYISSQIIANIDALSEIEKENYILSKHGFLASLAADEHIISCGSFRERPTLEQAFEVLTENNNTELAMIMFIHFKFAQSTMRRIPLLAVPNRTPCGYFLQLVESDFDSYNEYRLLLNVRNSYGANVRKLASDDWGSNTALYTQENGNRGRLGKIKRVYSNQLGIMLPSQDDYAEGLPYLIGPSWVPDSKGQAPDFSSSYVTDLINNDAIYVSGYSGMACLLLGLMEMLGNLPSEEEKKLYLCAICAYVVGGGFHSPHEVLGPAEYCYKLIPGYNVNLPGDKTALPPNLNHFYAMISTIDCEFSLLRDEAYYSYIYWFKNLLSHGLNFSQLSKQQEETIHQEFKANCSIIINKTLQTQKGVSSGGELYKQRMENRAIKNYLMELQSLVQSTKDPIELENLIKEKISLYTSKHKNNDAFLRTNKSTYKRDIILDCLETLLSTLNSTTAQHDRPPSTFKFP